MSQSTHPYPADAVQVIHTSGSERDIGRQHGEAASVQAKKGMVHFYFDMWRRMSEPPTADLKTRMTFNAAKFFLEGFLKSQLMARLPDATKERIEGFAEVAGLAKSEMHTTLLLPDLLPILQACAVKFIPGSFVPYQDPPLFGCTSLVSKGERFLVGRNLDFPGVAYWDRYPVIQSFRRKEGLAYIGVSSAGVPIGGITGINEAQITVSLHQHYSQKFSFRGTLPFVIGEEILSKATSLKQAFEILNKSRVSASWAFVVTDGKTRDAFIYECDPDSAGVRWLPAELPQMAHSNYFQCEPCQPSQYAASSKMNWDNFYRAKRLKDLAKQAGHGLTVEQAVKAMSDHYDPYYEEEKIINRTVSQVYNIQSLVWDPENMQLYLAEGNCPVQLRSYRQWDLGDIFAGKSGDTGRLFSGFQFKEPNKQNAKEQYILSFVAAMDGDLELARERIRNSLLSDFCPEAALTAAILSMKLGHTETAITLLQKALEVIEKKAASLGRLESPPEFFEIKLFLARAYDLLGNREKARREYRDLVDSNSLKDDHLRRLAMKPSPYHSGDLKKIITPYSTYIPLQ